MEADSAVETISMARGDPSRNKDDGVERQKGIGVVMWRGTDRVAEGMERFVARVSSYVLLYQCG